MAIALFLGLGLLDGCKHGQHCEPLSASDRCEDLNDVAEECRAAIGCTWNDACAPVACPRLSRDEPACKAVPHCLWQPGSGCASVTKLLPQCDPDAGTAAQCSKTDSCVYGPLCTGMHDCRAYKDSKACDRDPLCGWTEGSNWIQTGRNEREFEDDRAVCVSNAAVRVTR